MSSGSGSPQYGHPKPSDLKWGVACAPCASAKAKCMRSNPAPGSKCDRCQRLVKDCAARSHKVRKKRQSKPSRTAQLEERLESIIKQLQSSGQVSPLPPISGATPPTSRVLVGSTLSTASSSSQVESRINIESLPAVPESPPHRGPTSIPNTYNCHGPSRCICRPAPGDAPGPLDPDEVLLQIYREELMPTYPFVVISQQTTAAELQAKRPFLTACIRMVASFRNMRSMQGQLYQLMTYVSEHMLIRSERSLDLLLGIVVILSWHNFHCFLHSQLQNLTSLAMTLVAELGLKRPPSWQERTRLMVVNLGAVKERTNEERRLLLAVWHLSSCVSIGFQQLDSMRFSPYMQECLREIERAGEFPSDEYLVHSVKMQHLSERITLLDGRYDVDMESDSIPKAPVLGYVFALQGELDRLRNTIPRSLRSNKLIALQMNTVRLRLHEPPRIDTTLLASISKSFTSSTPLSSASSPLDGFYRTHAAIKTWFDDFLDFPVSSYYCVPLPISINMIYATIILSRWAKLFGPGMQLPATPQPHDPSGSYSNPTHDPPTPASSTLNDSPSSAGSSQLAHALATLKIQLATQPGLSLDVNGIMGRVCDRLDQVAASLAARNPTPQAREGNIWMLKAAKLRIAQFKLQQWTEMMAEEADEEEDEDEDGSNYDQEMEASTGKGIEAPEPGSSMMDLAGDQMADMRMPITGELYDGGMDNFVWTDGWEDWGFSFDPNGPFPQ